MSAEKQNKENSLGSKMDSLLSLPGEETFSKGAAWDKLYDRLEGRAVIRFPVYRVAAMALLLLVPVFFWMKRSPDAQGPRKHIETVRRTLPSTPTITAGQGQPSAALIESEKIMKPQRLLRPGKGRVMAPVSLLVKPAVAHPETASLAIQPLVAEKISPGLPLRESSHPVASLPKKKLKVVHLNELDEPAETESVARYSTRHLFQLKWTGQTGAVNMPATTGHPYEILKINLSSPN